jgi:hypothetical protein
MEQYENKQERESSRQKAVGEIFRDYMLRAITPPTVPRLRSWAEPLCVRKQRIQYVSPLSGWERTDPKLTTDDLRRIVAELPPHAKETYARKHFFLCSQLIKFFLGRDWLRDHIVFPKTGFLKINFANDGERERTSLRIFELAENLFNLHTFPGFYDRLKRLKDGKPESEQIMSTYAEILAQLLDWY